MTRDCRAVFAARQLVKRHYEVMGLDQIPQSLRANSSLAELRAAVERGGDEEHGYGTLEQSVHALPTSELRRLLQDRNQDSRGMRAVLVPRALSAAQAPRESDE